MSVVLPKAIHKHDRNYYNYYNSVDTYPIQTTTKKGNYTFRQFMIIFDNMKTKYQENSRPFIA